MIYSSHKKILANIFGTFNNDHPVANTYLVQVPSPVYRFPLFGSFCKQGMAWEGLYSEFFNFGYKSLLTESFYPAGLFKI